MKARRFLLAAVLSVVGCAFAVVGCGEDKGKVDDGHQHDYEWEITTPATCEHEGERKGTCKVCGNETTEKLDRAPHTLDGTPTVKEPSTCIKKGVGTVICSVCGTEQTVELDYAPHTLTHHDPVAGDCKTDGTIEYWDCSVCKNNFSDENGTIDATSIVIPKESYPHDYDERGVCKTCGAHDPNFTEHICTLVKVEAAEADCKTPGVVEHYKCTECGKLYKDAEGKELMTEAETVIPVSNDHNPSVNAIYHAAEESTSCAKFGRKESWDCKVCGRHFVDQEFTKELLEVGPDGVCGEDTLQTPRLEIHVYPGGGAAWGYRPASEPTCTSVGWKEDVYECSLCGRIYRDKEFDTNNHKAAIDPETEKPYPDLDRSVTVLPIDPSKHSTTPMKHEKTTEKPSMCGSSNVTYKEDCWECGYCNKLFSDEKCTMEVTLKEVAYFGEHSHLEEIQAKNSTCTERGTPHCWRCESCGEYFDVEDPDATTDPLPESKYQLDLIPHSFTKYQYNSTGHWYTCDVCGTDERDENGNIKMEDHVYGDDETYCICGYDSTNTFAQYFTFDEKSETEATITGLVVEEFANSTETVLTLPEVDSRGRRVTAVDGKALSPLEHFNYRTVFRNKITKIIIPGTINRVYSNAFEAGGGVGMTSVKEIEFKPSTEVVWINDSVFANLQGLEKITLPKHLHSFSNGMLAGCTSLKTVVMPEDVEDRTIGSVFERCTSLETIDFWCMNGKDYSLGGSVLYKCENLKEVYLPKGLKSLANLCMSRCTVLEKIHFGGTQQEWNAVTKGNTWNYLSMNIQNGKEFVEYGYTHDNNN